MGATMDGGIFWTGPVKPRNELRRCSQEERESRERRWSRRSTGFQTIIVEALRDFPEAYRARVSNA